MCTLTWWHSEASYGVLFNRDEQKTRAAARAPSLHRPLIGDRGVKFLAPVDGPSGGTWILVNEFGITLTLLNYYEKERPESSMAEPRTSRGTLLWSLAGVRSFAGVTTALSRTDEFIKHAIQPFSLVAFCQTRASGFKARRWLFDGFAVTHDSPRMPVCSSSVHTERVLAARRELFAKLLRPDDGPGSLRKFHEFDDTGSPSAFTVRMNRPDAQTLSISEITVDARAVHFRYDAQPAGLAGEAKRTVVSLERSVDPTGLAEVPVQ